MGNKTIGIEEDVHIKLTEIQLDLRKIKIERTLHHLHDIAVRYGIDNVFKIAEDEERLL